MGIAVLETHAMRVGAMCYCLLTLLAVMVAAGTPLTGLDALAADWAGGLMETSSEHVWLWITTLGGGTTVLPVMVVMSLMLWRSGNPRLVAVQWGGFLLARAVTEGLKFVMARERPPLTDLEVVLAGATNYAFPSGHATSGIYVYGFVMLLMLRSSLPQPAAWICALLLAVVIGLVAVSRIVLGVHFATDVAGGLLSGLAALSIASLGVAPDKASR